MSSLTQFTNTRKWKQNGTMNDLEDTYSHKEKPQDTHLSVVVRKKTTLRAAHGNSHGYGYSDSVVIPAGFYVIMEVWELKSNVDLFWTNFTVNFQKKDS